MSDETVGEQTRVELVPSLDHCVQTRAKQEYAATMSRILSGDESPELERRLELLKTFLEEADFSRLRRESEKYLTQGRQVRFVLSGHGGPGNWSLDMKVGESG
ncbi:MAG: hypothetical protein QUS33_01955 [Dehalococcoidia bacterium]|nr:hypothetical protein [Dehalococcoidia bacterium]